MRRPSRVVLVLAPVVLLAGVSIAALVHRHREQEWRHGGDDHAVSAQVRAVAPAQLGATLRQLGHRPEPGVGNAAQMAVVQVAWDGTSEGDGTYAFILLDDRLTPASPLHGYSAVGPGGGRGPGWNGAYQALAEHYPWLGRTADRRTGQGWTNDTDAFSFHAVENGEAVLTYYLGPHEIPTSHPDRDLALVLVYMRDGEVRWAKRVPLAPLPSLA